MNIPLITELNINQINTSLITIRKLLEKLEKELQQIEKTEEQNND